MHFFVVVNCIFTENRGYVSSYYWIVDTLVRVVWSATRLWSVPKWMKIRVFWSFFLFFVPCLIDGILRMDKSCDFWLISSVFVFAASFERLSYCAWHWCYFHRKKWVFELYCFYFGPTDVVIVGISRTLLRCFSIFNLFAQFCLAVFKQVCL
jgi:hypothetical protein